MVLRKYKANSLLKMETMDDELNTVFGICRVDTVGGAGGGGRQNPISSGTPCSKMFGTNLHRLETKRSFPLMKGYR